MAERLTDLVRAELAEPVDPRVSAMAAAIAAEHPGAARAVLFYGSCLRQSELDGLMLDFYLIVSDYRDAYRGLWLKVANTLLPPNVFPFAHDGLAAKYAVLSEEDFARLNGPEAGDVSVWARFAQPSRLVWHADDTARDAAVAAVARAAPTLLSYAAPMVDDTGDPLEIWRRGFALTYASELRAERKDRSGSIVDTEPERYRRFGAAAIAVAGATRGGRLGPLSPAGQDAVAGAARQGGDHLRRRRRLSGLEDQPPRRDADRDQALAAPLADPRRAYSAASSVSSRRDSLIRPASAAATADASALTVKGFLSSARPARSPASPASPT